MKPDPVIIETKLNTRRWAGPATAAIALAITGSLPLSACETIGFMAESYRKDSTHEIKAVYTGLQGKSFAVVVSADRVIQADHPGLVDRLTDKITQRLADPKNNPRAGGFVPAAKVMRYLYDNPAWPSKPMSELAKSLGGVDRLIYVDVTEYRLNDPGNAYEWDGIASGTVGVIEVEGITPDEFSFEKSISVKYPDKKGYNPANIGQSAVTTVLSSRFIDRASWLFYDHQEPYYPDY